MEGYFIAPELSSLQFTRHINISTAVSITGLAAKQHVDE
jgi:hypothetical protein